jgi:hypothetical protein
MSLKFIQELNELLDSSVPEELLEELGGEYSGAVESLNARVREIVGLLSDGLRDEAIGLAEIEPNVLGLAAKLDFPRRGEWVQFLLSRGIDPPPTINHDAAAVIEEAYEQQRQLEPLMRKHRLLALSRAPLQARLQILRRLEKADPTNPIWAGDIEKFEHARVEQIRQEATAARKSADVAKLAALTEELNGPWSIKVPADLRNFVAGSSGDLSRRAAIEQLKPLVDRLNDALSAFDANGGRAAREEWTAVNAIAQIGPGDTLHDRAAEALRWLEEVDTQDADDVAYEESLAKLERALDDEFELEQVEQRWYAVQRMNRDIPLALDQRYHEYRDRILGARRRRGTLRVAAVAAGILVVGALFGWYLFNQGRQRALAEARTQALGFRDTNNLTAADKWLGDAPPYVQKDGEVLSTIQQLRDNVAEIERIRGEIATAVNGVDLQGRLDEAVDAVVSQAAALTEELVKRKADPAAEQAQVENLRLQVEAERERRLRERTAKFTAELGDLAQQLKEAERVPLTADPRTQLDSLKLALGDFRTRHLTQVDRRPAVENAALDQVNVLLQRIEGRLKAVAEYQRSLERVGVLVAAGSDPNQFAKALTDFANDFPGSPWAGDFRKSATELDWWSRLGKWQRLAQRPEWARLADLSKDEAAALLAEVEGAEKEMVLAELADRVAKVKLTLNQIVKGRLISKEEIVKKLNDTYAKEDYRQQYVLVEKSERPPDRWRYLRGAARADANRKNFNYDYFRNIFRQDKQVKVGNSLAVGDIAQVGLAGQCTVATELLRIAGLASERSTEEVLVDLLLAVVADYPADDPAVADQPRTAPDPIVQANMAQAVLQLSVDGSPALADLVRAEWNELTVAKFNSIDWFEGDNPQTLAKRTEAEGTLKRLRASFKDLPERVKAWRNQAALAADWSQLQGYRWAGWLRNSEGTREVLSISPLENGQELFVLLPTGMANGAEFLPAGVYANGVLNNTQNERLYQSGRPVFIKQSAAQRESEQP